MATASCSQKQLLLNFKAAFNDETQHTGTPYKWKAELYAVYSSKKKATRCDPTGGCTLGLNNLKPELGGEEWWG